MIKFTEDEINDVFRLIMEVAPMKHDEYFEINESMFEDDEENLKQLVKYKVMYETDGNHKTDGQMVHYCFTFKNPNGNKSVICTNMCLMVGWNFRGGVVIN